LQYRLHLRGVVGPVGRGVQHAAGGQLARHERRVLRLHQAPLVMALLRPRIGQEEMDRREAVIADHVREHLERVVPQHAQICQRLALDRIQQAADARSVHLDGDEIRFRMRLGDGERGFAHARADLEHQRRRAPEELVRI